MNSIELFESESLKSLTTIPVDEFAATFDDPYTLAQINSLVNGPAEMAYRIVKLFSDENYRNKNLWLGWIVPLKTAREFADKFMKSYQKHPDFGPVETMNEVIYQKLVSGSTHCYSLSDLYNPLNYEVGVEYLSYAFRTELENGQLFRYVIWCTAQIQNGELITNWSGFTKYDI